MDNIYIYMILKDFYLKTFFQITLEKSGKKWKKVTRTICV